MPSPISGAGDQWWLKQYLPIEAYVLERGTNDICSKNVRQLWKNHEIWTRRRDEVDEELLFLEAVVRESVFVGVTFEQAWVGGVVRPDFCLGHQVWQGAPGLSETSSGFRVSPRPSDPVKHQASLVWGTVGVQLPGPGCPAPSVHALVLKLPFLN